MQPDLFPHSGLSITPEVGRTEPRLWVRKLIIWEKPDNILREIELRPGLNIIWSPDAGTVEGRPIGHGSGKTTFCRLIRYCLGEDSFAPEDQRNTMSSHFPEGYVGAEIILDGELWVVMRALGKYKRDIVIKNGTFGEAFGTQDATGIEPLRNAISQAIIGNAAVLMPSMVGEKGAWEAALAWASRDQECRFGHHLDWRNTDSNSNSPVRGRSREDMLAIVRALLGALTQEETLEKQKEDAVDKALAEDRSLLGKMDWYIGRTRERLSSVLGDGVAAGLDLDATTFKSLATQNLEKTLKLPLSGSTINLVQLRQERDNTRDEFNRLENELSQNGILINEIAKRITLMQAELPEAYARSVKEQNPICQICRVPIDKILAEGCGISTITCDLDALKSSIQARRDAIQQTKNESSILQGKEPTLKYGIATARQKLMLLENKVAAIEKAILERSDAIRSAERLLDDATRYSESLTERTTVKTRISAREVEQEKIKGTLSVHRDNASAIIRNLSMRFDTIIRELIQANIKGEIKLDGKGMHPKVIFGGERSTAAIDSLKVVAFDIATLTCTIEGKTHLPSFLLHDSPREADLGESIYRRLFSLMKQLENVGSGPLFQYIITTTTEPPEDCQEEPWLRLKIHGSPADERLMRTDL
jgi:hypothetical protein